MSKSSVYPETKEEPCRFCGKPLRLTRQGVPPIYTPGFSSPKRGTGYSYSMEWHDCSERDEQRAKLGAFTDAVTRSLGKK